MQTYEVQVELLQVPQAWFEAPGWKNRFPAGVTPNPAGYFVGRFTDWRGELGPRERMYSPGDMARYLQWAGRDQPESDLALDKPEIVRAYLPQLRVQITSELDRLRAARTEPAQNPSQMSWETLMAALSEIKALVVALDELPAGSCDGSF